MKAELEAKYRTDPTLRPLSPPQREFHESLKPERIIAGGNNSGKTYAGMCEARMFAEGRHPFRPDVTAPNAGWIVSISYKMTEEIIEPYLGIREDPEIKPVFPVGYGHWSASKRVLTLPNGSTISLMSCDQERSRFQGAKKRWVMFDEEPDLPVWNECGARFTAGKNKRLDRWICMTPLDGLSWTYDQFVLAAEEERQRRFIVFAALESNPAVTDQQLRDAEETYKDDNQKVSRLLGRYTQIGIRPAFPFEPLDFWLQQTQHMPGTQGLINYEHKFMEDPGGALTVWHHPVEGEEYALGADVAEGVPDGAFSVATVLRIPDRLQMCEWRDRIAPTPFGNVIYKLAHYYNEAFCVPEANNHGHATIAELVLNKGYKNVYQRGRLDKEEDVSSLQAQYGYNRGPQNKFVMEEQLTQCVRSGDWTPRSPGLLKEMIAASRDTLGRLIPGRGQYLDRVIAAGMASVGVTDKRMWGFPETGPKVDTVEWLREMIDQDRAERESEERLADWGMSIG